MIRAVRLKYDFGDWPEFAAAQIAITFCRKSNSSQKSMPLQTGSGSCVVPPWCGYLYTMYGVYHDGFQNARGNYKLIIEFAKE